MLLKSILFSYLARDFIISKFLKIYVRFPIEDIVCYLSAKVNMKLNCLERQIRFLNVMLVLN